MARFSSTPHWDPTITSEVRTILHDSGRGDLADKMVLGALADVETMARKGLKDHEDRLIALERERTDFLKKSGVWPIVKGNLDAERVSAGSRVLWAVLAGLGALFLTFIGWVAALAWKGAHS